jgi:hypothetical protein
MGLNGVTCILKEITYTFCHLLWLPPKPIQRVEQTQQDMCMLNTPVEFHGFKAIALYDAHRSVGQLFLQLGWQ